MVQPMWTSKKPFSIGSVERLPAISNRTVESLATRQGTLASMAATVVELAALKGRGASSELESVFQSFLEKYSEERNGNALISGNPSSGNTIANPPLKKYQSQNRRQPVFGPTTTSAARQSRERKAARRKEEKKEKNERLTGFL
jgi:hypothetical protein